MNGGVSSELDERIGAALQATARTLEQDIAERTLSKIREIPHLTAAVRAGLTSALIDDVQPAGRKLSIRSWEPAGIQGRLGGFDVVVGSFPHYRALFELKWAKSKDELGWTLWDVYKLLAGRLEYGARAYAIVGAPDAYWADEAVGCASLYCDAVWESHELFRRYCRDWKNLLAGGTARPLRIPAAIETRLVAAEAIDCAPGWELRALAVDVPGFDWLEFEGDWPVGHVCGS